MTPQETGRTAAGRSTILLLDDSTARGRTRTLAQRAAPSPSLRCHDASAILPVGGNEVTLVKRHAHPVTPCAAAHARIRLFRFSIPRFSAARFAAEIICAVFCFLRQSRRLVMDHAGTPRARPRPSAPLASASASTFISRGTQQSLMSANSSTRPHATVHRSLRSSGSSFQSQLTVLTTSAESRNTRIRILAPTNESSAGGGSRTLTPAAKDGTRRLERPGCDHDSRLRAYGH